MKHTTIPIVTQTAKQSAIDAINAIEPDPHRPMEVWRDIPGYEGRYKISNYGRVASTERCEIVNRLGSEFTRKRNGKILKQDINNAGYWLVKLCKDGEYKNKNTHRILAEAFIPNPDGLPCINHKDGNKTNILLDNLEWCTYSYNSKHRYTHLGMVGTQTGKFGKENHKSKAILQLTMDGDLVREWESGMDAVRAGYNSGNISQCCQGKKEAHKGYRWKYKDAEN